MELEYEQVKKRVEEKVSSLLSSLENPNLSAEERESLQVDLNIANYINELVAMNRFSRG